MVNMAKKHRTDKVLIRGLAAILEYQFGDEYPGMTRKMWRDDALSLVSHVKAGELLRFNSEIRSYLQTGEWFGVDILYPEEEDDPFYFKNPEYGNDCEF
jgi:hypothetical protein